MGSALAACQAVLSASPATGDGTTASEIGVDEIPTENRERLPGRNPVLVHFYGGGSIPLEAQELGLPAFASDPNPVPALITKVLMDIAPRFYVWPPVNLDAWPDGWAAFSASDLDWGAQGLAEDVRHYGRWMRNEAEKRVGRFMPKREDHQGDGQGSARLGALHRTRLDCFRLAARTVTPSAQEATTQGVSEWKAETLVLMITAHK
jgi:hypothetical protein